MSIHTCDPGHAGVLADGCERCDEHAASLLGLDDEKTELLWNLMVSSNFGEGGERCATRNDLVATDALYKMGVWMQRVLGIDPFVPIRKLRASLALEDVFVVFDGPPSHESGRFVEVESAEGSSLGPASGIEWEQRAFALGPQLWYLGPFKLPKAGS